MNTTNSVVYCLLYSDHVIVVVIGCVSVVLCEWHTQLCVSAVFVCVKDKKVMNCVVKESQREREVPGYR